MSRSPLEHIPSRDSRKRGKEKQAARISELLELCSSMRLKLSLSIQRQAAIACATDAALGFCVKQDASKEFTQALGSAIMMALHNLASSDSYVLMPVFTHPGMGDYDTGGSARSSDSDTSGQPTGVELINILPGAEAVASAANDVGDCGLVISPGSEAVASEADDLGFTSDNGTPGHGGTAVPFFDAKLDNGMLLPMTDTPPECYTIFDAIADEAVSGLPCEDMPASGPDTAAGCGHLPSFHLHKSPMVDVGVGSPLTTLVTSGSSISVQCNQFAAGRQGESSKDFNSHNLAQHRAADVHAHASPRAFDATSEVSPVDFKSQTLANIVERLAVDVDCGDGTPGPIKAPEPPGAQNSASFVSFNDNSRNSSGFDAHLVDERGNVNSQNLAYNVEPLPAEPLITIPALDSETQTSEASGTVTTPEQQSCVVCGDTASSLGDDGSAIDSGGEALVSPTPVIHETTDPDAATTDISDENKELLGAELLAMVQAAPLSHGWDELDNAQRQMYVLERTRAIISSYR